MRLLFLGTAAAEGVPAVFCNCDTCRRAKQRGGRDVRTRSQILIDGDMLFDFPMDTYMHMLRFGLDLSAVKTVLITHSHMDHCYPQEFCMRGSPFAHGMTERRVCVICNPTVHDIFVTDTARELRAEVAEGLETRVVHPFDKVTADDCEIVALPANHTVGEECLVYYVRRGGAGALLLNDTGALDADVYKRLADGGYKIDIATFDCTYGAVRHGVGRHMGLYDVADQIELITRAGLFNANARKIATHFSHNTDLDYEGISKLAAPLGIDVAYDGYEVEA